LHPSGSAYELCARRSKRCVSPEALQIAATRIITGADVDYGSLTRSLVGYLEGMKGFAAHYSHRVTNISREPGGHWRIDATDTKSGDVRSTRAKFVFLGAGGDALLLLQKSGIPEG